MESRVVCEEPEGGVELFFTHPARTPAHDSGPDQASDSFANRQTGGEAWGIDARCMNDGRL